MSLARILLVLLLSTAALGQTQPATAPATTQPANTWTADAVAKDPLGYLTWIDGQAQPAFHKLRAAQVEVAQSIAQLQTLQADGDQAIAVGDKALRELAGIYQAAEHANNWPAKWNNRPLSKEAVQTQMVSLYQQVAVKKSMKTRTVGGVETLKARQAMLAKADGEAKDLLVEVALHRAFLKAQAADEAMRDKLMALQSRTAALTPVAEVGTGGAVAIDDLAAAKEAREEPAFEQILNEYKK